jgi:hypothetical protein
MLDSAAVPSSARSRSDEGSRDLVAALACAALAVPLASCDRAAESRDASPASSSTPAAAPSSAADAHADHDCRTAHPPYVPPAGPPAIALSARVRRDVTTLRIFAYVGAVILRRGETGWVVAGQSGCSVPASRIERALDNLGSLKAEPSGERPVDGSSFELQIVAQVGEERALSLDVAGHGERGDLVQLIDGSAIWMRGLERELWSPNPRDWCGDP